MSAKDNERAFRAALALAGSAEDTKAMKAIAMRLARRGFDAAALVTVMVRLATDAAIEANAWALDEDERMEVAS